MLMTSTSGGAWEWEKKANLVTFLNVYAALGIVLPVVSALSSLAVIHKLKQRGAWQLAFGRVGRQHHGPHTMKRFMDAVVSE